MSRAEAFQANEVGKTLVRQGRRDEAAALFARALKCDPAFPEAHNNLANLLKRRGRVDEAIAAYRRAIALNPGYVEAHVNLGNTLRDLGRAADAIAAFRTVLALRPAFEPAENGLGLALLDAGHDAEAAETFTRLAAARPDSATDQNNLATALRRVGSAARALAALDKAIAIAPGYALAHANRGLLLAEMRRYDAGIAALRTAIDLEPGARGHVMALLGLLRSLGRAEPALDLCRRFIGANQAAADVCCVHAELLRETGQIDAALIACRAALDRQPDLADGYNVRGNIYRDQGRLADAIVSYRRALELNPDAVGVRGNLVFSLLFSADVDALAILRENRLWAERHETPLLGAVRPHDNARTTGRRLKVGYVCSYFRLHSAAFFLLPVLSRHNSERVEIVCYSGVREHDAITARFRALGHAWRDTAGLSDAELSALVRADGIDILVDLALHMQDSRLLAFARKPAPVQVTWLGYPGTTGLTSIDYRLTDPHIDPPGQYDDHYSERSLRLPDTFWCYSPVAETPPPVRSPPAEPGEIVFGCLNNFHKVTPATLALWARVLAAVPGSRMIILSQPGSHRDAVRATFETSGVAGNRISFVPRLPLAEYFRRYQGVDVCLDTVPYPGHTTTLDSLWMGVPVVTLAGETSVARGGVSILTNAGLPDLIARSTDDYVRIATDLARDADRRATLRRTLRNRLLASPLMDAARFAANLEDAYATMWATYCAAAPDDDVAAMFAAATRHHAAGNHEDAANMCRRILATTPDHAAALNLLGIIACQNKRDDIGVGLIARAIALNPRAATYHGNMGAALTQLGRYDEAASCCRRALALAPDLADTHSTLGAALRELGHAADAAACFRNAIALKPDHAEAHYNLSGILLAAGDFAAGWREYEWRWQSAYFRREKRDFPQPRWHGEAASGKTLLIHAEQGFGDTLQFCRYTPLVAARGLRVILEVPPPLARLMHTLAGVGWVIARGDDLPPFDLHCPMLSLPLALGTTLATIPGHVPYLAADPARVSSWAARLAAMPGEGRRVGLAWAGSPEIPGMDRRRSLPPALLAPLFDVPGTRFFSLQKSGPAAPDQFPLVDLMGEMTDFADTAALVANLDLVVSVDTSVAHLAGALGKPVFLLDRFAHCWRWLNERTDSPWYPALRIFRQARAGAWEAVIADVVRALEGN